MHNYACRNELARGFKPAGTLPPLGELEGALFFLHNSNIFCTFVTENN